MFSWQNATDKCAVINVDGYIVLNGVCEAISEARIFPCDKSSDVNLFAELSLNTNRPPATHPSPVPVNWRSLYTLIAEDGFPTVKFFINNCSEVSIFNTKPCWCPRDKS
jgi:hypothetical protein